MINRHAVNNQQMANDQQAGDREKVSSNSSAEEQSSDNTSSQCSSRESSISSDDSSSRKRRDKLNETLSTYKTKRMKKRLSSDVQLIELIPRKNLSSRNRWLIDLKK